MLIKLVRLISAFLHQITVRKMHGVCDGVKINENNDNIIPLVIFFQDRMNTVDSPQPAS